VSRAESLLPGRGYTVRLLMHLRDAYPEHRFSLVVGADVMRERHAWWRFEQIERLADLIVLGRSGAGPGRGTLELPRVSSTQVRALLAAGEPVDHLVPAAVLEHVRARGLYV
jgi:nicotinate-nucleotide adenylyltransferase